MSNEKTITQIINGDTPMGVLAGKLKLEEVKLETIDHLLAVHQELDRLRQDGGSGEKKRAEGWQEDLLEIEPSLKGLGQPGLAKEKARLESSREQTLDMMKKVDKGIPVRLQTETEQRLEEERGALEARLEDRKANLEKSKAGLTEDQKEAENILIKLDEKRINEKSEELAYQTRVVDGKERLFGQSLEPLRVDTNGTTPLALTDIALRERAERAKKAEATLEEMRTVVRPTIEKALEEQLEKKRIEAAKEVMQSNRNNSTSKGQRDELELELAKKTLELERIRHEEAIARKQASKELVERAKRKPENSSPSAQRNLDGVIKAAEGLIKYEEKEVEKTNGKIENLESKLAQLKGIERPQSKQDISKNEHDSFMEGLLKAADQVAAKVSQTSEQTAAKLSETAENTTALVKKTAEQVAGTAPHTYKVTAINADGSARAQFMGAQIRGGQVEVTIDAAQVGKHQLEVGHEASIRPGPHSEVVSNLSHQSAANTIQQSYSHSH